MKTVTKRDIFYWIVIILILISGIVVYANHVKNLNDKYNNYEKTIAALNDSIHVSVKNGIAEYSKQTPEILLSQLTDSEYFKTLSADQQKFYNDLKNIEGLISSTKAEIQLQGQQLADLKNQVGTVVTDSTGTKICYTAQDTLKFAQQDTSKVFKWTADMTFNPQNQFKPVLKMDYDYNFTIQTDFVRQKDKSIVVNWKINDPDLKVNKMNNFIIPQEQKKTALGRWLERNKKPITVIGGAALFSAGGYVGYKLAK